MRVYRLIKYLLKPKRSIRRIGRALALAAAISSAAVSATNKYAVLHNFRHGKDGGYAQGMLVLDATGELYGVTGGGGVNGLGTIFRLHWAADHWTESVIYNFDHHTSGDGANGSLAVDKEGNLYGTTTDGGPRDVGTVYQLSPGSPRPDLSVLYGYGTNVGVILDNAGNVYGSFGLGNGSGAISELINGSHGWKLKTLYSFCSQTGCADGEDPLAPLSWDAKGNLYGTTYFGGNAGIYCPGSAGCGVAFQMTHNRDGSWTYHVLHRFANFKTDGQYPYGGLTVDAEGNAYGTTTYGGNYDNGTVFELTPSVDGWKQTVLYDFPNIYLGRAPGNNLLFDKAGNLYGTAGGGNLSCPQTCGVIFKLTPQARGKWKYSLVHKFTGTDGDGPNGLTMDGAGNLYGTTMSGGQYNYGVAFELTP
jgi:uncharacterized repeat protein (TIGR03803 family)